jgi:hypothetical protein
LNMKILASLVACLLWCVLCSSDQTVAILTSPRAVLALALLFWARCEFFMRQRVDAVCGAVEAMCHAVESRQAEKLAKKDREAPVNLSDYHALLCEIKSLNQTIANLSSQQTLLREIRVGVLRCMRFTRDVLGRLDDSSCECIEMARKQLRRTSLSESCISMAGAHLDRCRSVSSAHSDQKEDFQWLVACK